MLDATHAQVAMDAAGNAFVAWMQDNDATDPWNDTFGIRARRYDVTAPQPQWGAPEPVSDDAYPFAMFPDVGVDAAGNAIVVWQAGDSSQFEPADPSHIGWNRYVAP